MIRVLLVDDSTFVRRFLRRVLSRDPEITIVGEARSGEEALELARIQKPDVITLDLELPDLWGIEVLRRLRTLGNSSVVVVVSSFTREGSEIAFQALEEGAFDYIDKSQVQNRFDFSRLGDEILTKVRLAAGTRTPAVSADPTSERILEKEEPPPSPPAHLPETISLPAGIIVIGASTGGPPAIRSFLKPFYPGVPVAILIVQHMPPAFVSGFTQRLTRYAPLYVHLLQEGMAILPGHAYVVPSGCEVSFSSSRDKLWVNLRSAGAEELYRPSIDRTLLHLCEVWEGPILTVILTGMGSDAVQGARRVKEKGGLLFIQNEESCVIFGMPKAVKSNVPVDTQGTPEELGILALRWAETLRVP
jgi:two-component system chemotaxis response regulator CheB